MKKNGVINVTYLFQNYLDIVEYAINVTTIVIPIVQNVIHIIAKLKDVIKLTYYNIYYNIYLYPSQTEHKIIDNIISNRNFGLFIASKLKL